MKKTNETAFDTWESEGGQVVTAPVISTNVIYLDFRPKGEKLSSFDLFFSAQKTLYNNNPLTRSPPYERRTSQTGEQL